MDIIFVFFVNLHFNYHNYIISKEYDPNPLLSLGKRKQKINQNAENENNQPSTSANCFSFHKDLNTQIQTRDEKEANK